MAKINYYAENLHSERLRQVYETELPRVAEYLEREIDFVRSHLKKSDCVLEIAAGYGRIMREIAPGVKSVTGIDISEKNVAYGKNYLKDVTNAELLVMDAHRLDMQERFDAILCLQNGLSSVKADDPEAFVIKMLKSLKNGGTALFSTYHPKFWEGRLAWFREQAAKGLLGELDMEKTKEGVIVCRDGFRATTHRRERLEMIGRAAGYEWQIFEVDDSSLFLVIKK